MISTLTLQNCQKLNVFELCKSEIQRWAFDKKRKCVGKIEIGDFFIVLNKTYIGTCELQYQILTKYSICFLHFYY